MSDKPHFSQSQLEMFAKCPEQWRRRYIDGDKQPPGVALLKGRSFHVGAAENFTQKIESGVDLPASQIVEAAIADFDEACGEVENVTAGDKGDAVDDLVDLVIVHAKLQAPDYQPAMVEETIRVELPGPRDLLAIIDIADTEGRVTDFKTTKKSKSQRDADTSIQLTVYASAYYAEMGREASELRLDSVVQGRSSTKRQVISTQRTAADFAALGARIDAVQHAITAGAFPPASPGSWWCDPRYCGFYRTCRYVNGGGQ